MPGLQDYDRDLQLSKDYDWQRDMEKVTMLSHQEQVAASKAGELYRLRENLKGFIQHEDKKFVEAHCRMCWDIDHMTEDKLREMESAIVQETV